MNTETTRKTVTQVTEREWVKLFETFPPHGWTGDDSGRESWYCPELHYADMTTIGVRIGSDFYFYVGKITTPHAERIAHVNAAIESGEVEQSKNYAASEQHGADAWQAFCDMVGEECADPAQFEDAYCGEWDSERAYSDNLLEECCSEEFKSDSITARYFDYDAFCRDLFLTDCYFVDGHVFRRDF